MMHDVRTVPCLGCKTTAIFTMTEGQFKRFKAGDRVQDIFPDWSDDDREMLISGTCPSCFEEMFPEDEEEEEGDGYGWAITDLGMTALDRAFERAEYDVHEDLMGDEGDQPEYRSDYYVDE